LHQLVRDHFETFRAQVAHVRDGQGLPRFVEQEFRDFLTCGCLAAGFARFRCADCRLERLVPFSCKGRGFCPSCGGRRMTDRAAHLVERVFPAVPVRQWVLTLPPRLRYLLAWDHDLCRAVVAVYLRAVLGWLRRQAHRRGVVDGRGGAVAVVQRFGAALNLNVHVHALVLDGVYAPDGRGGVSFRAHDLRQDDVGPLLVIVQHRIAALLHRRGVGEGDESSDTPDRCAEDAPALAGLAAASVQGVAALGARAGARVRRWGDAIDAPDPPPLGRWHARRDGFDLHAGIVVPAGHRDRLERLCRYALRPPVGQDRLQLTRDGQAVLELRRRWTDGTTHLVFDPVELLERLAALTPRPRVNLILYHGVLAPRAAWRRAVVPGPGGAPAPPPCPGGADFREIARPRLPNRTWAELMQRSFGFDVLVCPRCAGRLKLVALIQDGAVIQRILRHLGLPDVVPAMRPSRAPPLPFASGDDRVAGDDF
jgi:hypothetical protein